MSDKRSSTIEWTAAKRDRFRIAMEQQIAAGIDRLDVFEFDGHKFLLGYAKYLLEFLDKRLGPTPAPTPVPKRKPTSKPKPEPRRAYARSKGGR